MRPAGATARPSGVTPKRTSPGRDGEEGCEKKSSHPLLPIVERTGAHDAHGRLPADDDRGDLWRVTWVESEGRRRLRRHADGLTLGFERSGETSIAPPEKTSATTGPFAADATAATRASCASEKAMTVLRALDDGG